MLNTIRLNFEYCTSSPPSTPFQRKILNFSSFFFRTAYCQDDRDFQHGSVVYKLGESSFYSQTQLVAGIKRRYRCNRGYVLKGSSWSTCLAAGRWSNDPPTCEPSKSKVFPIFALHNYSKRLSSHLNLKHIVIDGLGLLICTNLLIKENMFIDFDQTVIQQNNLNIMKLLYYMYQTHDRQDKTKIFKSMFLHL